MKKLMFSALALTTLFGLAQAKPYTIDMAHSSVSFDVKHLSLSKVKGSFSHFDGKVDIDPKSKKINSLEGSVQINSVDTKNQKREDHLNAPDFFDSKKFPDGKFVMTKHEGNKIYGNLTLRGVTKPVVWDVEVNGPGTNPMTKQEFMAIEITGKVNRKDFDIGKSFGDMVLSDLVNINIQLEVYAK